MIKIITTKQTHFLKPHICTTDFSNSGYMEIDIILWTLQIYFTKKWEKYLKGK